MSPARKTILISSVSANNDPYNYKSPTGFQRVPPQNKAKLEAEGNQVFEGPHLTLFKEFEKIAQGEKITDFYLLTNQASNTEAPANELKAELESGGYGVEVHITKLDISDPTDYRQVYGEFERMVLELQEQYHPEDHDYYVFISPGTPTMHSVWFFLVKSELLPADLLTTKRPKDLQAGEPSIKKIELEIKPMPLVQKIRRETKLRYYQEERRRGEGIERISRLLGSNRYGPSEEYGFYQITHSITSPNLVQKTLASIGCILQEHDDLLSEEGYTSMEKYIEQADIHFKQGFDIYQVWEHKHQKMLKDKFRCQLGNLLNLIQLENDFPNLTFSLEKGCRGGDREFYIEYSLFKKGLYAILSSMDIHAYPRELKRNERKVEIYYDNHDNQIRITIADHGQGIPKLKDMFQQQAGNEVYSIRQLTRYFNITVENRFSIHCTYNLNNRDLQGLPDIGNGLKFILTAKLPEEKERAWRDGTV